MKLPFPETRLAYFAAGPPDAYRLVPVPEARVSRTGAVRRRARKTYSPCAELAEIQHWLVDNVWPQLSYHASAHDTPGRSILTNAMCHASPALLICLDLQDFFGHVPRPAAVAAVAKVTGRRAAEQIVALCYRGGALPAGAPTSTGLASAAFEPCDVLLQREAIHAGAWYTRYVDDLAFSWTKWVDPAVSGALTQGVITALSIHGYTVHGGPKRRVMARRDAQRVTGLVVNAHPGIAPVRVPRAVWRLIRAGVHNWERGTPAASRPELEGLLAYAHMVEPAKAAPFIERFRRATRGRGEE